MARPIRVLHVEDDPEFGELTAAYLGRAEQEFSVTTVTSSKRGIEYLEHREVECIVSDFEMPELTGIEFLERVRETDSELPFILFTGKGSEEVASEAISAGVTDYLQKSGGNEAFELLVNRIENAVATYRAQDRLARERDQYRDLFEQAPVMYTVTRMREGQPIIESCNREFLERLGYERDEVLGRPLAEFYAPESTEALQEGGLERALEGSFETEERGYVAADGDVVRTLLRAVPRKNESGEKVGTLALGIDITERKRQEADLQRYRHVIGAMEDHVCTYDREGRYLMVNESLVEAYGRPAEEFRGRRSAILDRLEEEFDGHPYEELIAGERDEIILESSSLARSDRTMEYRITRLMVDGSCEGAVGVSRDVTERKVRERELERERDRLDAFVGVVSHDLRNPLNVATSRLELAREDCDTEHHEEIVRAHDRMERVIDEVLTLAREGERQMDLAPVDLSSIAEQCWDNVDTADATLRTRSKETIHADARRLTRCLENLFRNAVEHGGETITVTVGDLESGFFVEDDGPGIPAGTDVTDLMSSPGRFGLSIVGQVVAMHEWNIRVCEGRTGGARFEITGVERC